MYLLDIDGWSDSDPHPNTHLAAGHTAAVQLILNLIHERNAGEGSFGELPFPSLRWLKLAKVCTKQLGHDPRVALIYGLEKHVQPYGIIEEINPSVVLDEDVSEKNESDKIWMHSLRD